MNLLRYTLCLVVSTFLSTMICNYVLSTEIPYDIEDRNVLESLIKSAKKHHDKDKKNLRWKKILGISYYQLAYIEVDGTSEEAVHYLKDFIEHEPNDFEMLAYLGSAYTMVGRDSHFVVKKVSSVNKGLSLLDKAVKKSPKNLTIRYIRASVTYSLPPMFGRRSTSENDYKFILQQYELGSKLNPEKLEKVYFNLGEIASSNEEKELALTYYQKSKVIASQSN